MNYETQMRLASNLKQLRLSCRYSQKELAEQLDINRSVLAMLERGARVPDAELLCRFAEVYGLPMEILLNSRSDRIVQEWLEAQSSTRGEVRLIEVYRSLTLFSRGRLLERAEDLLLHDQADTKNEIKKENE